MSPLFVVTAVLIAPAVIAQFRQLAEHLVAELEEGQDRIRRIGLAQINRRFHGFGALSPPAITADALRLVATALGQSSR